MTLRLVEVLSTPRSAITVHVYFPVWVISVLVISRDTFVLLLFQDSTANWYPGCFFTSSCVGFSVFLYASRGVSTPSFFQVTIMMFTSATVKWTVHSSLVCLPYCPTFSFLQTTDTKAEEGNRFQSTAQLKLS